MNNDIAWRIIQAAFRSAREFEGLLPVLKEQCSPEEYRSYSMAIATAIDQINVGLTNRVLAAHPQLAERIESDLAKFGHIA